MFFIKLKFFMMLSMVCMGLFSRFMLGFPGMSPLSAPLFQRLSQNYYFPNGGGRTSSQLSSMRSFRPRRQKILEF